MSTSPRSRAPRAAAESAAHTASTLRTSLYRLPGVHHTEATHISPGKAAEHEMAGSGRGRGRGARLFLRRRAGGMPPPSAQAPFWGVLSFAQAHSSARVPAFPVARWDTKG